VDHDDRRELAQLGEDFPNWIFYPGMGITWCAHHRTEIPILIIRIEGGDLSEMRPAVERAEKRIAAAAATARHEAALRRGMAHADATVTEKT
jgi:hypothetical protein